MENSILNSVADFIGGIESEDFETALVVSINSAFLTLHDLGCGPKTGFRITGENEKWTDYEVEEKFLPFVQNYICLKTKMVFDPPANATVFNAYTAQIAELETRLNWDTDVLNSDA